METRYAAHPQDVKYYDTERLRKDFLIDGLFVKDTISTVYSHVDRIIVGGAMPCAGPVALEAGEAIRSAYFLERRELGVINIGGPGSVSLDGVEYALAEREALYVGKGVKDIIFSSRDGALPAKFYFNSAPAHMAYPTMKIDLEKAKKLKLGTQEEANKRTIYQYIHPQVLQSCQLVMGMTVLEPGSVWNTMPTHTHDRRMEVYLYLNIPDDARVFHFMGEPQETRHIVVHNEQAVISPSWSIHSGVGTKNYTFIWGMVGENQEFTDMDHVAMHDLK